MKDLNKELSASIRAYMIAQSETIAVAESVTSGLLQWYLSLIPDASKFFQGGITAYNVGQKYKHLMVEFLYATSVNGVSARVAVEMAKHCCYMFASEWSIAVTGYASAVPESGNERFAFYAIAKKEKILAEGKLIPPEDHPENIQRFYAHEILGILGNILDKRNAMG